MMRLRDADSQTEQNWSLCFLLMSILIKDIYTWWKLKQYKTELIFNFDSNSNTGAKMINTSILVYSPNNIENTSISIGNLI